MTTFDFRKRKSVHVSLLTDTHREFRKILIDHEISMQEAFQKFSELAVMGDKRAQKILEDLSREKKEGLSKNNTSIISIKNLDNIYSIIERENFLGEEDD